MTQKIKIAFIVPVCSRGQSWGRLEDTPFATKLFSSFIKTTTQEERDTKYEFKFFVGCDDDDGLFAQERIATELSDFTMNYGIKAAMFQFGDTTHNPVQAWNHLARVAYDAGFDYIYQTGDDVEMVTPWTDDFISALESTDNIGVAAPKDLGYHGLYTQSFVHRTHIDIMGSYYPDTFKNWYVDDFLTGLYKPNYNHYIEDVHIKNTGGPQRYAADDAQPKLIGAVACGMIKFAAWMDKNNDNFDKDKYRESVIPVYEKYEEISKTMTTAPAKPIWSKSVEVFTRLWDQEFDR